MHGQLDQIEKDLATDQAEIDDQKPDMESLLGVMKASKYGGSSNPEVSGSYGMLAKDSDGFGLADKHGIAIALKMDLSLLAHLDNGGELHIGFGPAWTPGGFPTWVLDDTDEEHKGLGTASRLGVLLDNFKASYKKSSFEATGGFMSFQTSDFSLSGPLGNRPVVFDHNPYQANQTSKSYFENQFLTGVPKRAPEESEHYIMGLRTDWGFAKDLTLMDWVGNYEAFYDNSTMAHEYGGYVQLDKKDRWGGIYRLIGYNRSNDSGEIAYQGGDPNNPFFGLINNTVISVTGAQKIKHTEVDFEVAHSNYRDNSGPGGYTQTAGVVIPVVEEGLAWKVKTETSLGDQKIRLGAYSIDPSYIVEDQVGKYTANGNNLLRFRDDPDHPGGIIQQTVVADPTIPINDSLTYNVGGQLRLGNAFLNLNLQNSSQLQATDARIWASHYEGGSNLNEATWFVFFNNNYQSWLPPSGKNGAWSTANLEREFFYNPRRDAPSAGMPTTFQLDAYNETYSPLGLTSGAYAATNAAPVLVQTGGNFPNTTYSTTTPGWNATAKPYGVIPDKANHLYYDSYRQLEVNLWRRNYESIVNSDRITGQADLPSQKYISDATGDLRINLGDWLPFRGRALFFQTYGEILTVNDSSLAVPSLDPQNLFVQSILDGTLVYNLNDSVNLMLNMGIENWATDRVATQFTNNDGQLQNGTLEYHDRQGGVGLDWNAIPNKLNLYFRVKLVDHYDSFASQNSFQARQAWWEMKSFF